MGFEQMMASFLLTGPWGSPASFLSARFANETLKAMRIWRLFVFGMGSSFCCLAQKEEAASSAQEVRRVVDHFMGAVRKGDAAGVAAVSIRNARQSTAGGTVQADLKDRLPSWKHRSNMIRRVEVLSPTTGIAIGVWRDFDATPPFDTGTFHYTLIRKEGSWKISYAYESFLPSPQTVSSVGQQGLANGRVGEEDWDPLFDGQTLNGWSGTDPGQDVGRSWRIEDGCLIAVAGGPRSGLLTRRQYLLFDLQFEWMAAAKTNSGVKYRLYGFDRIMGGSREVLGFEYQIADDDGDPGARVDPRQRSGALYSIGPVEHSVAKPLGQWNQSRIAVSAGGVKHWLNGTLTATYATDIPFASAIALQHHTTEVRFRNIRVKSLPDGAR